MTTNLEREIGRLLKAGDKDISRIVNGIYARIRNLPPSEQIRVLRESSDTVVRTITNKIADRMRLAARSGAEHASLATGEPVAARAMTVQLGELSKRIHTITTQYRANLAEAIKVNIENGADIRTLTKKLHELVTNKIPAGKTVKQINKLLRDGGDLAGPDGYRLSRLLIKRVQSTTGATRASYLDLQKALSTGNEEILANAAKWWIRDRQLYQCEVVARTETIRSFVTNYEVALEESGFIDEIQFNTADDDRTCDECNELDGQRFPIAEGLRPPIHPLCRCSISAVIDRKAAIKRMVKNAVQ